MIYSCCTGIENHHTVRSAGYDRIILPAAELALWDAEGLERAAGALSAAGLSCAALNSFCPPALRLCGPGYDREEVGAYAAGLAKNAGALGVAQIGIGAPGSRSIPEGYSREKAGDEFLESLKIICGKCAGFGIEVLLEAVCSLECNHITTTEQAAATAARSGLKNLFLVFDIYHAAMMDEGPEPLSRAMPLVRLVHTAKAADGQRHYLDRDGLPSQRPYFDTLLASGYNGEVAVEALCGDISARAGETLALMRELCREGQ